jgi:CDP-2,3-bis-(O-geranylgeranyl)-sn-glycerol synthase
MDAALEIIRLVLFVLPAYFANSTPVLLGGGVKMDFGRNWPDGRRIFGDGKTVRGFFSGILAALLIGALQALLLPGTAYSLYGDSQSYILAALLLGFGTMLGDLLGSFIKRRQGVAPGKPSLVMDQLLFLAGALALAYPVASGILTLEGVAFLLILTYFVHISANVLANRMGLKKVPW